MNKAVSEMRKRHLDKAEAMLRELAGKTPVDWKASSTSNDTLYCAFWDAGEAQQCREQNPNRTIIPVYPSYAHVFYLLGFIRMEKGDAGNALKELNAALALEPDHPVILIEKGTALAQLKRHQEAYDCFVLAEKQHYASTTSIKARALRSQGVTLIDLNRLDEAERCFERSLELVPDNKLAWNEIEYIRRIRSGASSSGNDVEIRKVKE